METLEQPEKKKNAENGPKNGGEDDLFGFVLQSNCNPAILGLDTVGYFPS